MAALTLAWESRDRDQEGLVGKVRNGGGGERQENMFEKVLTPSDVGKLNRLVVPKHFAEKYFPLGPASRGNPAGTVLCFEDARGVGGLTWCFRYSYWSSSQSYVMTKGWSRFVRDKRLAAGDTVSFCRAGARLFVDCRRRGAPAAPPIVPVASQALTLQRLVSTSAEARGRCLRLFGVDLELRAEPLLLDLLKARKE